MLLIAIGLLAPILMLLLLIPVTWKPGDPLAIGAFATFLGIEATLAFAALFGVGIPRYVMGVWPAIVLAFGLAGYYFLMSLTRSNQRVHR